jgi:hypothetical protein
MTDTMSDWWTRNIPRLVRSAYRRVVPRFVRVFLRTRTLRQCVAFIVWIAMQTMFARLQFGAAFFCVSLIIFLFASLDYGSKVGFEETSFIELEQHSFSPRLARMGNLVPILSSTRDKPGWLEPMMLQSKQNVCKAKL